MIVRARCFKGSAGMLPALSGMLPDGFALARFSPVQSSAAVFGLREEPPVTYRRQRAECSRSRIQ
jgi:hypothetical protein